MENTNISDEQEKQLTTCTEQIQRVIKLNYDAERIKEQSDFIENIVDVVTTRVGLLYPVYKTHPKLRNGSFYQGTKILQASEFDFLNPLVFSDNNGIKIENYRKVYMSDEIKEILSEPKKEYELAPFPDAEHSRNLLCPFDSITSPIHKAVRRALKKLHSEGQLKYMGQCNLKRYSREVVEEGKVDLEKLKQSEIMLDENRFGPCITLAVGGPLCVSHVDLTFCLKDHKGQNEVNNMDEKLFVLPRNRVWILTKYTPGHYELDEHHRKILMILKYCLLESKRYVHDTKYDSHLLKMIVNHHQESCDKKSSLGKCFYDVTQQLFQLGIDKDKSDDNLHLSPTWLENLRNVGYPPVTLLEKNNNVDTGDMIFTLVLYILVHFMKSSHDARFMLSTREVLSVCLQLISKYSMKELVTNVGSLRELTLKKDVKVENIESFITELSGLRYKGGEINILLSALPFPYPPYWPDSCKPIKITQDGTIEIIHHTDKNWTKWKEIIDSNRLEAQRENQQHVLSLQRELCSIGRPNEIDHLKLTPEEFRQQQIQFAEDIKHHANKRLDLNKQADITRKESEDKKTGDKTSGKQMSQDN
ncbi:unnamed protein product [Owenia fusiformis]|uniref:Uncharacterized protein n=1 Tax=Owenia fusiformis TaxID=6347 RepID=A0A8J1UTM2_OWEFU|nr:unnamed protein product [Owenia fusiformis]